MARIIFMGTPEFAATILEGLVVHHEVLAAVTQPDQRGGRGRKALLPPPVKVAAMAHGVPVMQPKSLRRESAIAALRELRPDVIVVAAFGQILRPAVLALPPHGCLNVHASLLPRHRGAAPVAAAILAGDAETGVTIMLMDEGVDTGAILAQRAVSIAPTDTTGTLTARLAATGRDLLLETLPRWLVGEVAPQPQDEARATYAPPLTREDGRIDWTRPAVEIARMVRAFDPWPGAHTTVSGNILKIIQARALPDWRGDATPGTVVRAPEGLAVATGEGALLLEIVQPAGKRPMTCQAYACGQRDLVGTVLSS